MVVDDGADERTAAAIEREGGGLDLKLLRAGGGGPARARNLGWRAASGRWIAFTDDDCEATPGWLAAALAAARTNPGAIVQGPTLPIPRERARLGPFARTRSIAAGGPWFETCNIVYEAELLERLDGFDEAFAEALGEDTDLGWRALGLGRRARLGRRGTGPSRRRRARSAGHRPRGARRQRLGARLRPPSRVAGPHAALGRGAQPLACRDWGSRSPAWRSPAAAAPRCSSRSPTRATSPPAVATSAPARSRPRCTSRRTSPPRGPRCAARPATAGW